METSAGSILDMKQFGASDLREESSGPRLPTSPSLRETLLAWQHTLPQLGPQEAHADGAEEEIVDDTALERNASVLIEEMARSQVTSVVLRFLPFWIKKADLRVALRDIGLGESYDFLYLPHSFKSFANLGYAFINFDSTQDAIALVQRWHGRLVFRNQRKELAVVPARNQGLEQLLEMCRQRGVHKIHNDDFRPFFRGSHHLPVAL